MIATSRDICAQPLWALCHQPSLELPHVHSTCKMLESDWSDARRAASSSAEIENCSIPAWECVASHCGALRTRFHVHIFAYLRDAAKRDTTHSLASRCEPAFRNYHCLLECLYCMFHQSIGGGVILWRCNMVNANSFRKFLKLNTGTYWSLVCKWHFRNTMSRDYEMWFASSSVKWSGRFFMMKFWWTVILTIWNKRPPKAKSSDPQMVLQSQHVVLTIFRPFLQM